MHTASFPLQPTNIFQSVIRIPGFTPTKEKRALWKANKTQVPHSTPVSQFPSAHPPPNSPLKNRLVKSLAFCSGLSDGGFSIFLSMELQDMFFCLQSYLDISFFANVGKSWMLKGGAWGSLYGRCVSFDAHGKRMHLLGSFDQPQALWD